MTARTDSSKMGNVKINNIDKTNNKIIINNFRKNNSNNNVKLLNEYNMYSNLNNNYEKFNEIKNKKKNISINRNNDNNTDINMIFQSKEKAKTFNRQSSNQNIKISSNIYKNKSNQINENSKNKIEKNIEIYKRKLINENLNNLYKESNKTTHIKTKISIKNNCNIIDKPEIIKNNSKRNTDSIIQMGNKDSINNENTKKIKNKVKTKDSNKNKEKDNIYNYFNYTVKQKNNNIIYEQNQDNKLHEIITNSNSFKKNNSLIPLNNYNYNNGENLLKNKKNIDINIEYQKSPICNTFSPEKNIIINNLNNTTRKVKLKSNNYIANIEMGKEKQFLTENITILKTKSKAKQKLEKNEELEMEIKIIEPRNNNYIFNNKRISTNNTKYKINEIYTNNLTDENAKNNNINNNNYNNNNMRINCGKAKIKQNTNEQINRNNTYNNNESSFFTMNINNSNIDEINNNEPKNNLGNYNFISNAHNNDNINNINNKINNTNYIFNNNKISNVNVLKSNSNTNKNNFNFPIFYDNNFSNCNTGNTSNNILNGNNNFLIKKDIDKEIIEMNNKIIERKNTKEQNNEMILIELDDETEQKDDDFSKLENKKDIINPESFNKIKMEEIKDKDISLDNSNSIKIDPNIHEDFIDKDDEFLKLLNPESIKENNTKNNNINNNIHQNNDVEESEIIKQNSEFYTTSNLYNVMGNDVNQNSNIYESNNFNYKNNNINNNNNPNINLENINSKDTSIISNIGIKGCKSITQAGKERTGHRKKNQDNYIIEKNLNTIQGFNLFAVLDGHGENGHIVSQLASKYLVKKFTEITNQFKDIESIYNFFKQSDFQKIIDIFLKIDNEIIEQKKFDISLSGSTCVLVIQLGDHLICSNIGDSRAILIYEENNENKIFELSYDSKPDVPEEKKRINLMGGTVDKVTDENGEKTGPYRVYIKNMDQPGLAMSRSFGDKKAKSCGVIPYPDINEYNLNNNYCKYMVICSDGVWEFLSNEEVMEIGNKYYNQNNMNDFCKELLKKSTEMWESEENYMDDITIVVVFFLI